MKFAYASGSRPLEGYTIKRGIGVGGFGEVYFAISDAGKEVALKRVQRHLDVELRGVTQCLNLKHVNLIGLYDIRYNDEGEAWVVMEYVQGESLKDAIEHCPGGMPTGQVRFWFQGIAEGVKHLHEHGIVHRDLKPGNIFLDDQLVKIGDYGLSKFISCSRRSGQTESVGTFHYMAPEIGKGVYGKEIDIYALGVILYEMITGRVPFDGESSQEIIMKHLTADPDLSGLAEPYRSVVRRALLKDPEKRFHSVGEMAAALSLDQPQQTLLAAAPPAPRAQHNAPLYIADDQAEEGIHFGPVKEVVTAEAVGGESPFAPRHNGEPIAQAVSAGWRRTGAWWRNAHFSAPIKVMLVLAAVFLVAISSEVWVPLALLLAMTYFVYLAIRGLILAIRGSGQTAPPPAASRHPHAPAAPPAKSSSRRRRRAWRETAREQLRHKSVTERLAELTGAMLLSAVVAAVLGLVMMVLSGASLGGNDIETWSFYAWMTLVSVIGSWAVLAAGKGWEGREGEPALRRFMMLVLGLALGAAAFGAHEMLLIEQLGGARQLGPFFQRGSLPPTMFESDGTPLLPGFLVYFGGLYLILAWWKQADPLRTTRLSLWTTATCAVWAWILPFPQPYGVMSALAISIAVQLSAPWMSVEQRANLRRQPLEA